MKIMLAIFLFLAASVQIRVCGQSTDWNNGGGNPSRNGLSSLNGPSKDSILWEGTSPGLFGMPVYMEANRLATMRFLSMNNAPIVCHDMLTGDLLWTAEITGLEGRSLPVGFRDGTVYAVRYTESLHDTLYALSVSDGSKIWTADVTVAPYITASASFADNGDLLIEGYFKMYRIDHETGHMIWETDIVPFTLGEGQISVYGNTGYLMENVGGVAYVVAIDIGTGEKKYSHIINDTHPGGGIPQVPLMVGPDGTIFVQKQGDNVTALQDDGTVLNFLWETEIFGNSPFSMMCVGSDGSVYAPSDGRMIRLNPVNGEVLDSTGLISTNAELFQLRASASANGIIYATNGENGLYAYTPDLQLLWSDNIPNVNTSGAAIGANGLVAVAGAGSTLRVYVPEDYIPLATETPGTLTGDNGAIRNYPNPFGASTTIEFFIEKRSYTKVTVLNSSGQEVAVLLDKKSEAGYHTILFNSRDLADGFYFCRLRCDGKSFVKPMLHRN
jgi:outer membrane protein assembly factor BamB